MPRRPSRHRLTRAELIAAAVVLTGSVSILAALADLFRTAAENPAPF